VAPYPPDLDCSDVEAANFRSVGSDPHGFDGDGDGAACEA
jgi:micrococcal nuclease